MAARVDAFKYSGGANANDPAWRVVIALGPSRLVEAWIVLVTATALAAVLATPLPAVAQAAASVALSCAAVRGARRHACREGHGAIAAFVVDLSGRIEVESADGTRLAGQVRDGSFVAPWLTIVRWRPDGARISRSILVAPDAVAEDSFRRLRVLLRWR
jgi:toxin CptA